jgi:Tol biopolymer transport system component
MFSAKVSTLRLRGAARLIALALLATTLLVGCGSGRGAAHAHKTSLRWSDLSPAWSSDGKLIVFLSDRPVHKQWDLFVVNGDGSHLRRLTNDKLSEDHPVFLSNGKIAFAVRGKPYVIGADGRGRTRLLPRRRARPRAGSAAGRAWVAFARGSNGFDDIYVMRRDGSGKRLVATGVTLSTAADFYPQWSPDRRMVAFDGVINNGSQIYVVRASAGDAKQVSRDPGVCCPTWSWNGKELFWVGDGVTIARANGSDSHRLAGTAQLGVSAVTSLKDGRRLLLEGDSGAYVVNSDGTGLRELVKTPDVSLVLSPDQTRAAFEEPGGPDKCLPPGVACFPRYSRIDVVDLNGRQLRELTQR